MGHSLPVVSRPMASSLRCLFWTLFPLKWQKTARLCPWQSGVQEASATWQSHTQNLVGKWLQRKQNPSLPRGRKACERTHTANRDFKINFYMQK